MAARKSSSKPGVLIDVARFISASQDRATGKVVFRFRDEQGRLVALRLRRRQFRTLAASGDRFLEAPLSSGSRSRYVWRP